MICCTWADSMWTSLSLLVLLHILTGVGGNTCDNPCTGGRVSIEDGFVNVGSDVRIECTLSPRCLPTDHDISEVYFVHHFLMHNDSLVHTQQIPREYVRVISNRKGKLHLKNVTFHQRGNYSCHLRERTPVTRDCSVGVQKLEIGCGGSVTPVNPVVAVGSNFSLVCSIDSRCLSDDYTVHDLYFVNRNQPVPKGKTRIMSPRSIALPLMDVGLDQRGHYSCHLNTSSNNITRRSYLVGLQKLHVDYPPASPVSHQCISYNLRTMNCSFIYPYVHRLTKKTNITVTYSIGSLHTRSHMKCTSHPGIAHTFVNCMLPTVMVYEDYTLYFNSSSDYLGVNITKFVVTANSLIVKPDPVKDVTLARVEAKSVTLSWLPPGGSIRSVIETGLFEMDFKISLSSNLDQNNSKGNVTVLTNVNGYHRVSIHLSGLTPFTRYRFTISTKPSLGSHWSDPTSVECNTEATAPEVAPVIPPGGFSYLDCNQCEKVRVYWQDIPIRERYGEIESFEISYASGKTRKVGAGQYFSDFNVPTGNPDFTLKVSVRNAAGISKNASLLIIPVINKQADFNVAVETVPNARHKVLITWIIPKITFSKEFIIYTCQYEDIKQNCKTPVEFMTVPEGRANQTIDVHDLYGFSLSNAKIGFGAATVTPEGRIYSGISWQCILSGPSAPKRPRVDIVLNTFDIVQPRVELSWPAVGCQETNARVDRYQVDYCESQRCQESQQSFSVRSTGKTIVTKISGQLYPRTKYSYDVTPVTRLREGVVLPPKHGLTFVTKSLPVFVTTHSNPNTANVSLSGTSFKQTFIRASWVNMSKDVMIPPESKSVLVDIPCQMGSGTKVHFRACARLPGDHLRQLSDAIELEMCLNKPLETAQIVLIAIGCIVAGIIIVLLVFACRYIQNDCSREQEFRIPAEEDFMPVRYTGDEDEIYMRKHKDEDSDSSGNETEDQNSGECLLKNHPTNHSSSDKASKLRGYVTNGNAHLNSSDNATDYITDFEMCAKNQSIVQEASLDGSTHGHEFNSNETLSCDQVNILNDKPAQTVSNTYVWEDRAKSAISVDKGVIGAESSQPGNVSIKRGESSASDDEDITGNERSGTPTIPNQHLMSDVYMERRIICATSPQDEKCDKSKMGDDNLLNYEYSQLAVGCGQDFGNETDQTHTPHTPIFVMRSNNTTTCDDDDSAPITTHGAESEDIAATQRHTETTTSLIQPANYTDAVSGAKVGRSIPAEGISPTGHDAMKQNSSFVNKKDIISCLDPCKKGDTSELDNIERNDDGYSQFAVANEHQQKALDENGYVAIDAANVYPILSNI